MLATPCVARAWPVRGPVRGGARDALLTTDPAMTALQRGTAMTGMTTSARTSPTTTPAPDATDRRGRTAQLRDRQVEQVLDRIVEQGRPRLHQTWAELLATAVVAGMEVALGVLALLAVSHATGNALLAGLAFSVGFIALLLGHSELFTEGFLVPVIVVAAREATGRQLLRFWTVTLVGNLAGGWARPG